MADFSEIKSDSKSRMDKTIETLRGDFGSLRAGRAHVSLLDGIMVEAYGSMTPLSQVGTVSVPDPRTLSISIWDRSLAKAVDKALRESDLGLNPASDGQLIRIPIPPLSEERRKELVKIAGKYAFKTVAVGKSGFADTCNRIGNCYIFKAAAFAECTGSYATVVHLSFSCYFRIWFSCFCCSVCSLFFDF